MQINMINGFFLLLCVMLLIYILITERKKDSITNYNDIDLVKTFEKKPNGETWLLYRYNAITQPEMKKYILKSHYQDMEIFKDNNFTYVISELISDHYFQLLYDNKGNVKSKIGPYIAYKVIPKAEKKPSMIHVNDINGPVQIATEGSSTYQIVNDNTFSDTVSKYKNIMIKNGISEDDINTVINNPKNDYIKKSFLSKYGLNLAKIIINISDVAVSLLNILQK